MSKEITVPDQITDLQKIIYKIREDLLAAGLAAPVLTNKEIARSAVSVVMKSGDEIYNGNSPVQVSQFDSLCVAEIDALIKFAIANGVKLKYEKPSSNRSVIMTFDYNSILAYKSVDKLISDMKKSDFDVSKILDYGKSESVHGKRLTVRKIAEKFFSRPMTAIKEARVTKEERRKDVNPDYMEVYKTLKIRYGSEKEFLKIHGEKYKSMIDFAKFAP